MNHSVHNIYYGVRSAVHIIEIKFLKNHSGYYFSGADGMFRRILKTLYSYFVLNIQVLACCILCIQRIMYIITKNFNEFKLIICIILLNIPLDQTSGKLSCTWTKEKNKKKTFSIRVGGLYCCYACSRNRTNSYDVYNNTYFWKILRYKLDLFTKRKIFAENTRGGDDDVSP